MKRQLFSIKIGPNLFRYRVKIEDDPSLPNTQYANTRQKTFLKLLIDNIEMLNCGPNPFQKMNVHHNGACWIVELESTVENVQQEKDST